MTEVYIMDMDWLEDGRKIPDAVMFYMRRRNRLDPPTTFDRSTCDRLRWYS